MVPLSCGVSAEDFHLWSDYLALRLTHRTLGKHNSQDHLHFIESPGNFPLWAGLSCSFTEAGLKLRKESLGHCQKRSQVSIRPHSLLCFDLTGGKPATFSGTRARFTSCGRGCGLLFRGDCRITLISQRLQGRRWRGHGNRQQALGLSDLISGHCFRTAHLRAGEHASSGALTDLCEGEDLMPVLTSGLSFLSPQPST